MTLVKFNNNKQNNSLLPGINDVLESVFNDTFFSDRVTSRVPAMNIGESTDHFHIELAAPGLNKQDFKLSMNRNILSISVDQSQDNNMGDRSYSRREFSYNSFMRSFTLPEQADHNQIEAVYQDGVLRIDIAKKEEAKTVSRQIEIK